MPSKQENLLKQGQDRSAVTSVTIVTSENKELQAIKSK
jgi:hypothetical protein